MLADQGLRRSAHALDIQWPVIPGNFMGQVSRPNGIVVDHIAIASGDRREARVKILWDDFSPGQTDVSGQVGIRAMHPVECRAVGIGFEMDDLTGGMYARIGTAGTKQIDRVIGDAAKGFFYRFLNAFDACLLTLPATIGRAAIFDAGRHPGNNSGRPWGGRVCD